MSPLGEENFQKRALYQREIPWVSHLKKIIISGEGPYDRKKILGESLWAGKPFKYQEQIQEKVLSLVENSISGYFGKNFRLENLTC